MRRPVSPPSAAEPLEVRIERIGAEGDGVTTLPGGERFYLPLTLPGELVRIHPRGTTAEGAGAKRTPARTPPPVTAQRMPSPVMAGAGPPSTTLSRAPGKVVDGGPSPAMTGDGARKRANDIELLQPSPDRIVPPCAHFGACGGCTLQHWQDDAYAAWKSDLLRDALRRAGYADPPVAPLVRTAPAQRRRMDLAAQRTPHGVAVGLHRRESHSVVDLHECAVLHPTLFALLAPLRAVLPRLRAMRRDASIIVNLLDNGPDLLLRTDAPLDRADREALIGFARAHSVLRVSWGMAKTQPEPIIVLQPPRMTLSGIAVELPPGGFLQASPAGEAAIIQAVLNGLPQPLPPRARVAELYAGSGSLTFALAQSPLTQRIRVAAWEGDAAAATALRQAANLAELAGRIEVTQRDLARQPLSAAELSPFAAVVLDPPFAGAAAQATQIAASKARRVIYVSCNPAVLARDARPLHEAGFTVLSATPVDQFLWSARLESVCVFAR